MNNLFFLFLFIFINSLDSKICEDITTTVTPGSTVPTTVTTKTTTFDLLEATQDGPGQEEHTPPQTTKTTTSRVTVPTVTIKVPTGVNGNKGEIYFAGETITYSPSLVQKSRRVKKSEKSIDNGNSRRKFEQPESKFFKKYNIL
ncbi:hypothetical protein GCK72_015797 [Caenorhabditis remanei]|uniref:Uncharacterized protein n=1 Tax=Caenorhabditis remanei TaxID=31234 RepID=A0A6A5GYE4_CAERE|nr:hypothetical protein GCK72_015797 [Caenorhabditis remanei]KAF1759332.1 hypothetical protein GCK72_015797 [Caenorhabditis remanei]